MDGSSSNSLRTIATICVCIIVLSHCVADINGNDYVDWEEFTSFCIELGIVTGKVWTDIHTVKSQYRSLRWEDSQQLDSSSRLSVWHLARLQEDLVVVCPAVNETSSPRGIRLNGDRLFAVNSRSSSGKRRG